MTRNTVSELHNCGHEAIDNTKLPDFYTLVLNNCQQFTIAEREKYRCESSFKVQSLQNVNQSSRYFSARLDIHSFFHNQNKLGNINFYIKKTQCYNKIPFMSLKCICHSFLVALRKQKQCLKSCCRTDQNQMLLMDNFVTAESKVSYFVSVEAGLLFLYLTYTIATGMLCVKSNHHFPQRITISRSNRALAEPLIIFSNKT